MRLFRRRGAGRHAAPAPGRASVSARTDPAAPVRTDLRAPAQTEPGPAPAQPAPSAGAQRRPPARTDHEGTVRLGFSDGSAVALTPDDPRARAFRAVARELGRRD